MWHSIFPSRELGRTVWPATKTSDHNLRIRARSVRSRNWPAVVAHRHRTSRASSDRQSRPALVNLFCPRAASSTRRVVQTPHSDRELVSGEAGLAIRQRRRGGPARPRPFPGKSPVSTPANPSPPTSLTQRRFRRDRPADPTSRSTPSAEISHESANLRLTCAVALFPCHGERV